MTYTNNPTPSFNVPTHQTLEIKDEIVEDLKREIYFHYKDGVVLRIFHHRDEPFWITNVKRGIINLLSVNVFGKIGNEEETMFKKLEVSVAMQIFIINCISYKLSIVLEVCMTMQCFKSLYSLWKITLK